MVSPKSSLQSHAFAGSVSGFSQSLISLPFELAKVRMQISGSKDTLGFVSWLVKANGIRALWPAQAFGVHMVSMTFGNTIYYFTHEAILRFVRKHIEDQKLAIGHRILIGGATGVIFWLAVYPLDGLKTRLLANPDATIRSELSKKLPIALLYRGLLPTVVRAFFTNAAFMTTFSLLRNEKT